MTRAVCISCGARKIGALTPCPACEHRPESTADQARAILFSDSHLDKAALRDASERIRAGEAVPIDEELLAEITQAVEGHTKGLPPRPIAWKLALFLYGMLVAIFILPVAVVVYLAVTDPGSLPVFLGVLVVAVGLFWAYRAVKRRWQRRGSG